MTDVCLTLTSILKWDKNSGDGEDDSDENGDLVKSLVSNVGVSVSGKLGLSTL